MDTLRSMLASHPQPAVHAAELARCAAACKGCAATCLSCADACLAEEHVAKLRQCIRENCDCAALCTATASILLRQTEPNGGILRAALEACAQACLECGRTCESHAQHMDHCRICAAACRECEAACRQMLEVAV